MKYKLFISDFDGTLGKAPDFIDRQTVESIKEYEKKGGKFVICTGRSYLSIKKVFDKYGLGGIIVAFQGALAIDDKENRTLFDGGIDKQTAQAITLDMLKEDIEMGVYIGDIFHYERKGFAISEYQRLVGVQGKLVDSLVDTIKTTDKQVRKALAIAQPEKVKSLMCSLSEKYKGTLTINASAPEFLEIINPEWSKGKAVERIAKHLNIPLSSVITVGDSLNDKELIDGNWHGVVVGDAMEEVKPYAKEITVDFKDNPVKFLLEKYCL